MTRSPLAQLYFSRLREFYRQPARIFWVYGFPTVLAVILGLAFKNRPPDVVQFDLVKNSAAPPVESSFKEYEAKAAASGKPRLVVKVLEQAEARKRLMTGKTPLV